MSDEEFDFLAMEIDLSISTGRPDLDKWWRENFNPYTGNWIRSHPEFDRVCFKTEMALGLCKHKILPMTKGRMAELTEYERIFS